MKLIAYVLGMPVYFLIGFGTMPLFFVTKWLNAKIYNSIDSIYLGMIESGIEGGLFVFTMKFVFGWFKSPVPILFIAIVSISIFLNNFKRYQSRPNKNLQLGYLIGESISIIACYVSLGTPRVFF